MKPGTLAFVFDDAYKTDLSVGMQAQLDRGWEPKGTSYLITSYTGELRLTVEEKLTLLDNGWDLQCHSHTHPLDPNFTGMTSDEIHEEMQNVNAHFVNDLGIPPPEHHTPPGGATGQNTLVRNIVMRYRKTMMGRREKFIGPKPIMNLLSSNGGSGLAQHKTMSELRNWMELCLKHGFHMAMSFHMLDTPELVDRYNEILDHVEDTQIQLVTISELYKILTQR